MKRLGLAAFGDRSRREGAACERVIALYDADMPRLWWRALLSESRPVFGPESRFAEAPMRQCAAAVEAAIKQGYRPALFVPHAAGWPLVQDQLGPLASVSKLYVRGRDDDAMRDLLHSPSANLVAAAKTGATILVPEREYGKALDAAFRTSLTDFLPVDVAKPSKAPGGRDQHDFYSRLNPYRRLSVVLDDESAAARMRQVYLWDDPAKSAEPCEVPVWHEGQPIRFAGGDSAINARAIPGVLETLRLPAATRALWMLVAELMRASAEQTYVILADEMRSAVAQVAGSAAAIARIGKWLKALDPAAFSPAVVLRGDERPTGQSKAPGAPTSRLEVPFAVFVGSVEQTARGYVIRLVWIPAGGLAPPPQVVVEVNKRAPIRVEERLLDWAPDASALTLLGLRGELRELGWRWDRPDRQLRLKLRIDMPARWP